MDSNTIFWIISILISVITLVAMVFGIRLGNKALSKTNVFFGIKATEMYEHLKTKETYKNIEKYPYGGGKLTTPQLKIEKIIHDPKIELTKWQGYEYTVRFFEKKDNDIMVEEWLI